MRSPRFALAAFALGALLAGAAAAQTPTAGNQGSGGFLTSGGALGTPSSGTGTNITGLSAANISAGILAVARGGTGSATGPEFAASTNWFAILNPNNAYIQQVRAASTVTAILGRVMVPTGGAATVSVYKAASATACSAGTVIHSGSFNANGTADTLQTLTVTAGAVTAGQVICLVTTGTTEWTLGTGVGGITVFYTTP